MAKRVVDFVIGALLVLLTLPLMALLAVALAFEMRSWPFFVQDRVGLGGRVFRIVKLRTLPPGTAPYADKYQLTGVRQPWLARTVRRLHLDELPQLLLVVRGHMSLVGPRPEMPHLYADMPDEFVVERTRVRPGCTGLWQISVAYDGLISEAPEYDRFYVRHSGWRLDAWILLRTVAVVAFRRPAITHDDVPGWVLSEAQVAEVTVREAAAPVGVLTESAG